MNGAAPRNDYMLSFCTYASDVHADVFVGGCPAIISSALADNTSSVMICECDI